MPVMREGDLRHRLSNEPVFLNRDIHEDDPVEEYLPDHVKERLRRDKQPNMVESELNLRLTDPDKWMRMVAKRGMRKPLSKRPPKVETPKTAYNRERLKKEAQKEIQETVKPSEFWK